MGAAQLAMTFDAPAASRVPVVRNSALYEAGSQTRRTLGWRAPTASPNTAILATLATLRDRSRAATRNDGYAKGVIDKLVTNLIGTGIKPLSKATDVAFRQQAQALWLRWTDESDADGLLDWYGQQAQAARTWLEGGEAFIRLRPRLPIDGLSVPLQAQILEPELCPHTHNATRPNGNRVRAGIEFNAIGKRVAYWMHPSRPGDLADFDPAQLRRIPAEGVIHLYDPLRPGQLRGLPILTQALIRLRELDKFDDATLLRQQLANLFVAFVKRPSGIGDGETVHPLTGAAPTTVDDKPMIGMEPGIVQELAPGEDMTFSDPPDISSGYRDFMRQQLYSVCAATGVPYEVLTGDMSGLNDRVVRVILNEFAGRIEACQHQIIVFQLCRPVYQAWMDRAFLSGALPIPAAYLQDPSPWTAVKFTPPRRRYIHPVQDVEAQEKAIRNGFTSRAAIVSEYGEDAETIDAEQKTDNDRADDMGLKYDSDARHAKNATPAPAPPVVEEEPEGAAV
jgi:lambda family phage portal protein